MKVIFLDFDGVLNSETYLKNFIKRFEKGEFSKDDPWFHFKHYIDPAAVEFLNEIIEKTDSKVVVSSSWRLIYDEVMPEIFKKFHFACEYFDSTGPHEDCRGTEIQKWLNAHPDVENYVIIDDDSDMLESQMQNFVHTSWEHGLDRQHTDLAIEILNRTNN